MFNLQHLKGIFLDLDDTLYSYSPCNKAGTDAVVHYLSKHLHREQEIVARALEHGRTQTKTQLHHPDYDVASSHSRLLYFQRAIEELTGKTNATLTLTSEKIFWDTFLDTMDLFPDAQTFLERAKTRGEKIAIVTNLTTQIQLQKFLALKIDQYIDTLVSSEESGREKPNPASLVLALQKLKLQPHEVVMVGEDEEDDVLAAHAVGITPIIIHKRPNDSSLLFAKNFNQLITLLSL